jgi:DNA-binding transcriptional MerR regulator
MLDANRTIHLVARRTGLFAPVIRIWEQRCQACEPRRTAANHWRYSQTDIKWLGLLRVVTHAGHNISQLARLSKEDLRALAANASDLELQAKR